MSSNFGVLYDGRVGGFTVDLTAFRSVFDIDRTDYTLLIDRKGQYGILRAYNLSAMDGSPESIRDYRVWLTPKG